MTFADILLPIAAPTVFTYAVPEHTAIGAGMRVRVPLGKSKICEGIVLRLHDTPPVSRSGPKYILDIRDTQPFVLPEQIRLWEWIASYYLCPPGEVLKAAMPAGIRNSSYQPSAELFVRLAPPYRTARKIAETLDEIHRAKKQSKALLAYLAQLPHAADGEPVLDPQDEQQLWVLRADITEAIPGAVILKLIERGILEQQEIIPSALRRTNASNPAPALPETTSPYAGQIAEAFEKHPTVLLSGEIGETRSTTIPLYISLAAKEIAQGRQALLLLPDTVMTTQVTNALQTAFGPRCLFYHSRLTDRARSAAWQRMIEQPDTVGLVVGTRSALFLPFRRLGLAIVDNEQDPNYRQSDPAPRYHARDAALMLAHLHQAKTLLASPAPSAESWLNAMAETGKYGSVVIPAPSGTQRPVVTVLERGKGLISKYLHKRIGETLAEGRQAVLFQNRRGFAPYVECANCGATPTCPHCNVTLTYHKESSALVCHYCGWSQPYTSACAACGMRALTPRGIGTERIEEYAAELFPDTKIARMDTDTMKGAGAAGRILDQLAEGETGILVGTQMVARTAQAGEHIGLVGVINADNMLAHPDFRAAERAFQLLTQLKALLPADGSGELVIQSSQRLHPVLTAVANHDPDKFYLHEMRERQQLLYPPYVRMLRLTFRHPDKPSAAAAAQQCETLLRERFGRRVSPPFEPQVDRVQNLHIFHILLRIERQRPVAKAKAILAEILTQVRKQFPAVHLIAEADPQ
ncbi:primosomal protein N' [uncultured Rikenella sp.]|uniref:replication restart helicase PriA n=1 Tax=uncultured Rikenella sp. TaxID=368003 RepID=UPI00262F4024|nr:primosomal protein N' [uncultured Rikenella sp.]